MSNEEKRIVTYVMFGKREELIQFPETSPVQIITGPDEITEFRPVYLFWDKTDELLLRIFAYFEKSGKAKVGRFFSFVIKQHIQNKYKEVFLGCAETLLLSERAEHEIPHSFWRDKPVLHEIFFRGFAQGEAIRILGKCRERITVCVALNRECRYEEVREWLRKAEEVAGIKIENLFLFGELKQTESVEDVLEDFYEETGIAASFYPESEYRRILALTKGEVLLLDCFGIPFERLGRMSYYMDGTGMRTGKEMRRLSGVCKACCSLRNHLDRAFLSAL